MRTDVIIATGGQLARTLSRCSDYVYTLSGPWKRSGSFRTVSVGHTPVRRKRDGNVAGIETLSEILTETLTET